MGTFHHANRLDMAQQPSGAKTAQGRKPETRCKVEAADGQSQNGLSHNGHAASCTHSVLLPLLLVVLDKHFTGSLCMCSGTHAHLDRHLAMDACSSHHSLGRQHQRGTLSFVSLFIHISPSRGLFVSVPVVGVEKQVSPNSAELSVHLLPTFRGSRVLHRCVQDR